MEFSTFFAFLFLSLTRMNWYIRSISFPQIPPLLDIPSKFSSPIDNVTLTILREFVHQRYLKKKKKKKSRNSKTTEDYNKKTATTVEIACTVRNENAEQYRYRRQ